MATNLSPKLENDKEETVFLMPSPFLHRRQRTKSTSEAAKVAPVLTGTVKEFCRQKGHGFITPKEGGESIFVHVSDIDGDLVPQAGDVVRYQLVHIPPKFEKVQATHVQLFHLKEGAPHDHWASRQFP